jgi:hypothetical protein
MAIIQDSGGERRDLCGPGAVLEPGRESATAEGRKPLLQLGAVRGLGRLLSARWGRQERKILLAEGPHSQIAEDPERRWAEDL